MHRAQLESRWAWSEQAPAYYESGLIVGLGPAFRPSQAQPRRPVIITCCHTELYKCNNNNNNNNNIIIIIIIIIENRTEDVVINMITELSFIRDDIFLALVLSKTDIDEFISALCSTGI